MARQLRIEYEGGFYHITCRGNQREKIFWDAKDRERLKTILERTKERYGYLLHAFVFMDTREDDLLRWMKRTGRQRRIGVYLSKGLSRKRNADIGDFRRQPHLCVVEQRASARDQE